MQHRAQAGAPLPFLNIRYSGSSPLPAGNTRTQSSKLKLPIVSIDSSKGVTGILMSLATAGHSHRRTQEDWTRSRLLPAREVFQFAACRGRVQRPEGLPVASVPGAARSTPADRCPVAAAASRYGGRPRREPVTSRPPGKSARLVSARARKVRSAGARRTRWRDHAGSNGRGHTGPCPVQRFVDNAPRIHAVRQPRCFSAHKVQDRWRYAAG